MEESIISSKGQDWLNYRTQDGRRELVLSPHDDFEALLLSCGALPAACSLLVMLVALHEKSPSLLAGGLLVFVLGSVLVWLSYHMVQHYLLDFDKCELILYRTLFGRERRHRVCSFSQLRRLELVESKESGNLQVEGDWPTGKLYRLRLIGPGEQAIGVAEDQADYATALSLGTTLAQEVGIPLEATPTPPA